MNEKAAGSGPRGILSRLLCAVVAIIVAVLLAEIAVRLVMPQDPDFYNSEKFLRLNPPPGEPQTLIANSEGAYTGVPVHINSIGLRDREVEVSKPPGVFRVLVIGDSVTFGFGVRLEESYPKRLEARVNASRGGSAPRIEVINAGVPATGLVSYLQFLETKGLGLQPDLVLVGIVLNDIFDYDAVFQASRSARPSVAGSIGRELNRVLLLHSHLYLLTYMRMKSILYQTGVVDINAAYESDFLPVQPPSERQERAWISSLKYLGELVGVARRLCAPLALVMFPEEVQLDARSLEFYRRTMHVRLDASALDGIPQRRLAEFARAHEVPLIDLLSRFRASATGELFLRNRSISHDWVHLSVAGHELAADEIASALANFGLVPAASERVATTWVSHAPMGPTGGGDDGIGERRPAAAGGPGRGCSARVFPRN